MKQIHGTESRLKSPGARSRVDSVVMKKVLEIASSNSSTYTEYNVPDITMTTRVLPTWLFKM